MIITGFFILLAIAILVKLAGNRLFPLLMPGGRLMTIALGWVGGFLASWADNAFWQLGPQVAGVNLLAAVAGCILFILCLGIAPFIKILLGKV